MARKAGVVVEDVVRAAAEIADAEGWAAVTLTSVASRVGIRPPSLYAHVDGLGGLRRLLALRAAEVMAEAQHAAAGAHHGTEALRVLAHEYRRFATGHPGLYDAAQRAVRAEEDPELYRALGAVIVPTLTALAEAGIAEAERVHLTRALRSAFHGFVALERIGGFGMPQSVDESFRRLVDLLLDGVRAAARPDAALP